MMSAKMTALGKSYFEMTGMTSWFLSMTSTAKFYHVTPIIL